MTESGSGGLSEREEILADFADAWEKRTGNKISPEVAREYLDRLKEFFLLLNEIDLNLKAKAAAQPAIEV